MFISHDLHTVRSVCDEVMVLYAGERVESGSRRSISEAPWHPYTQLLISSVPELRQGWLEERGSVRVPETSGRVRPACAFFPRCGQAMPGQCDTVPPPARRLAKGADILCHREEAELFRAAIPAGP
jgi:peptide/nickel transport system ATP-binding protein